jgi:hypothetical protein
MKNNAKKVIKPSEGYIVRIHIWADSFVCFIGVYLLYANSMNTVGFSIPLITFLCSSIGYYIEEVLYLEYFLDQQIQVNKDVIQDKSDHHEKKLNLESTKQRFIGNKKLYGQLICVAMASLSAFYAKYPSSVTILALCPLLSINWVIFLSIVLSITEVLKIYLNSALAIDAKSRSKAASQSSGIWIIDDNIREKIKSINFWVCNLIISLYEGGFSVIGLWVPHFILPLPPLLMLVCGLSYAICNLLMQQSFNLLTKPPIQSSESCKFFKYSTLSFMAFSWTGKLLSRLYLFYFYQAFLVSTHLFSPFAILSISAFFTAVAVVVSGNYEFTKLYKTYEILEQHYFAPEKHLNSEQVTPTQTIYHQSNNSIKSLPEENIYNDQYQGT